MWCTTSLLLFCSLISAGFYTFFKHFLLFLRLILPPSVLSPHIDLAFWLYIACDMTRSFWRWLDQMCFFLFLCMQRSCSCPVLCRSANAESAQAWRSRAVGQTLVLCWAVCPPFADMLQYSPDSFIWQAFPITSWTELCHHPTNSKKKKKSVSDPTF